MSQPLPLDKKKKTICIRLYPSVIDEIKRRGSLQKWIESAVDMKKSQLWIPVSEKLPPPFNRVLIYFHDAPTPGENGKISIAWLDREMWWLNSLAALSRTDYVVTHWSYLPEVPEGK